MLKKGDKILVISVAVLIAVSFAVLKLYNSSKSGNQRIAVIKHDGKVITKINLDDIKNSKTLKIEGEYYNIVLAEDGRIRFTEANCPDQICVKTGWLTNSGDIAVCLPNKSIIQIEGENKDVDSVAF